MDTVRNNKMVSVVVYIMLAITIVSVFLLMTGSVAYAENGDSSFLELGIKSNKSGYQHQTFHRVDTNLSPRAYEEIYSHNQVMVRNTLRSYSNNVLKMVGIPEKGGYVMGAALGLVINDRVGLDLNKSKTLALEFEDVDTAERSLNLRIKLDW